MVVMVRGRKAGTRKPGIGRTLTELRQARDWSQREAAKEVGVSLRTWAAWELGELTPDTFKIDRICKVFRVKSLS